MSNYFSHRRMDWLLLGLVLLLFALGLMEIYSATSQTKFAGAYERQVYWILAGLVLMYVVTLIDYPHPAGPGAPDVSGLGGVADPGAGGGS